MGEPMANLCRGFVFLGALLCCALLGAVRAAEETPKEKSEVPAGYEDATEPKKAEAEREEPMKEEAAAEEVEAEVPAGYEDAGKAEKRKKRARLPAAVRPAMAKIDADNPQVQALAAQMQQQLKPYFAAELSFARTVCQPNAEQLQKMKDRATPELERTIMELAMQQAPQMGLGLGWPGAQPQKKDIREQFEIAASKIVSEVFSPEVVEKYEEEQSHRLEFRARAGAMALVAHLDKRFRLSQTQREALTDSMQEGWQRQWQAYLQFMGNNPEYFPPVPDETILPHLNEVQAKQWKSMKRTNIGFGWQHMNNHGIFREMKQEFDWFGDDARVKVPGMVQFFAAPAAEFELFVQEDEEGEEDKAEEEE